VKRSELIFNMVTVAVDLAMILIAGSLAYFLRYRVETIPVLFALTFQQYFGLILLPAFLLLIIFAVIGLYNQRSTRSFTVEIGRVATAVSAGLMLVVLLFFFDRSLFPSRLIILMSWVLVIALVSLARGILLLVQRRMMADGFGRHRLVVVKGKNVPELVRDIKADSRLGYKVVFEAEFSGELLRRIEEMHKAERVDELLQADTRLPADDVLRLIEFCENLGIKFNYLPSILETHRTKIETDVIGGVPVIRLKATPLDGWGKVLKRLLDVLISALALFFLSPFLVLFAFLVKLDSPGPVFFHQKRGSSFYSFEFYKFRTMQHNLSEGSAEGDRVRARLERENARRGPYVKIKNDPRVTKFGRFLRKTKLDELPQLWHVLEGKMSLVGPRIHMVKEVEHFESSHKKLFNAVKPGATGLAQINQYYNPELSFDEEVRLDLFYIENWSVWLDLYIIFKTIAMFLTKRSGDGY